MSEGELLTMPNTEVIEDSDTLIVDDIFKKHNDGLRLDARGSITSELSHEQAQELLNELVANKTYTFCDDELIDDGYACVCIDGRCASCMKDGNQEVKVRSKMSGGNGLSTWVGSELAQTEMAHIFDGLTANDRLAKMIEQLRASGVDVAAHGSTLETEEDNQCGAAMGLIKAMEILEEQAQPIMRLVAQSLGRSYDEQNAQTLATNANSFLQAIKPTDTDQGWKGTHLTDQVDDSKIETLESSHDATHNHHEKMLVLDFRKNKTLDRDNAGEQVFWVDVDAIIFQAQKVSSSEEEASAVIEAMLAYQVAVYLSLCDGSHPVAIVK